MGGNAVIGGSQDQGILEMESAPRVFDVRSAMIPGSFLFVEVIERCLAEAIGDADREGCSLICVCSLTTAAHSSRAGQQPMVPESTLGHIFDKVSERIRWMSESSGGWLMEMREIPVESV
jgi:hypothetical protein